MLKLSQTIAERALRITDHYLFRDYILTTVGGRSHFDIIFDSVYTLADAILSYQTYGYQSEVLSRLAREYEMTTTEMGCIIATHTMFMEYALFLSKLFVQPVELIADTGDSVNHMKDYYPAAQRATVSDA